MNINYDEYSHTAVECDSDKFIYVPDVCTTFSSNTEVQLMQTTLQ